MGVLVEILDGGHAHHREPPLQIRQVLLRENFFRRSGSPGHDAGHSISFVCCSPLWYDPNMAYRSARKRSENSTMRPSIAPLLQFAPEGDTTLENLSSIVKQLGKERDRLRQQLSGLNAALEAFAGVYRGNNGIRPRRKISAKGRARIAAAQRARWAKVKGQKVVPITKPKRTMSASARQKIAAAQRARWAKVRREKKAA